RPQASAVTPRVEVEHPDVAAVGTPVALEDLDGGGLAGAVGPEEPEDLARFHRERHAVEGAHRAVPLAEPGDFDGCTRRRHGPGAYRGPLVQPVSGTGSRSRTTTSSPRPARWQAADNPPSPAPTTSVRTSCSRLTVPPGDERAELLERDARRRLDRRHRERAEGLVHQPFDAALHLVDGAGVDEQGLQTRDLGVAEVRATEVLQAAGAGGGRSRGRRRDERGELALAQVVADRFPGDGGIAEDTQDVVAQLERLAQWQPERAQRVSQLVETAREGGA